MARPTPDDVRPSASGRARHRSGLYDGHQNRHTGKKAGVIGAFLQLMIFQSEAYGHFGATINGIPATSSSTEADSIDDPGNLWRDSEAVRCGASAGVRPLTGVAHDHGVRQF